jgi:hypothetical protein
VAKETQRRADDDQLREAVTKQFPVLTFWYGLQFSELVELPRWVIDAYVRALPRLLAAHELILSRAAVYPHLKPSAMRSVSSRLTRLAEGQRSRSGRVVPRESFEGTLAGVGIGVRRG